MFRRDLDEARSIWLTEVEKLADEHDLRTASKFLKPENANGEVADFHALRHTFITLLASSGVHPKVAQQLARHSTITLTMDRNSHTKLADLTAAVGTLPTLAMPHRLTMTGTDTTPARNAASDLRGPQWDQTGAISRDLVTSDETIGLMPAKTEPPP